MVLLSCTVQGHLRLFGALLIFFLIFFRKYDFHKTLLLQQIAAEIYQTSPELSLNGPHKSSFGIFEILKIELLTNCFFVFFSMGRKEQNRVTLRGYSPAVVQHIWGTFKGILGHLLGFF